MKPILECRKLSKVYHHRAALTDLTFSIYPGKIVGLLGPNGSGKTTLMKLINGLLHPTSGELFIDGRRPGVETKAIVSYLPEFTYLHPTSRVRENIRFFRDFYRDFDDERARDMLEKLDIDRSAPLFSLSKGAREKIQLILVMSRRAKLYCLDEPIAGVDPAARDFILSTILNNYEEDAAILISTHLIADVENLLDEFLFLKDGQLHLNNTVEAVRNNEGTSLDGLFREVYRC